MLVGAIGAKNPTHQKYIKILKTECAIVFQL